MASGDDSSSSCTQSSWCVDARHVCRLDEFHSLCCGSPSALHSPQACSNLGKKTLLVSRVALRELAAQVDNIVCDGLRRLKVSADAANHSHMQVRQTSVAFVW